MLLEAMASASRRLPAFRGKAQLARGLMRLRRGSTSSAWLLKRRNGDWVVLPTQSMMCWQTAFTGLWDDALVAYVGRYVRPGTVAIDVGASIGLWTIPLARRARDIGAMVVAVEPLPANARWLRANLALNDVREEVVVHEVALGSSSGRARLESSELAGGSAALAVPNGPPLAAGGVDVALRRLDDLPLPGRVSFMKLDVEGLEWQVLQGGASVIETDRPVILGEFSPTYLQLRGETLTPLFERFSDLGYQVAAVDLARSRPWRSRDRVQIGNSAAGFAGFAGGDLLLLPKP